jgi:DNA-directed RNA polymerase subunit M/transcription elongation factor TFIIS
MKYVNNKYVAFEIEKGIFEFALIHLVLDKLPNSFVKMIYDDKLTDICANLDPNNNELDNQTLLPIVMSGKFKPFFVSFLSPEQMHPKRWSDIINKERLKRETLANMSTTDLYKCSKCHEKKFRITELQLRCADEPSSKFLTCLVCFHTFIV